MTEVEKKGISKTTFIVGLIVAIVVSSLISTVVVMQGKEILGLKGDKGDTGPQGEQGVTGPKGDKGDEGESGKDGREVVFAQWDVTWRTLTGDLQWGAEVGTSKFSGTFDYNWGSGIVFLTYDDFIGFEATMQVRMQRDGPVTFTIGSDDVSWLDVDDMSEVIFLGAGGYKTGSYTMYLSQGAHTLTLWYYDKRGYARVSFECDSDILMWHE